MPGRVEYIVAYSASASISAAAADETALPLTPSAELFVPLVPFVPLDGGGKAMIGGGSGTLVSQAKDPQVSGALLLLLELDEWEEEEEEELDEWEEEDEEFDDEKVSEKLDDDEELLDDEELDDEFDELHPKPPTLQRTSPTLTKSLLLLVSAGKCWGYSFSGPRPSEPLSA